ncbi:TPA: hypothetical protein ACGOU2_002075, partial [Streptococcus suis]
SINEKTSSLNITGSGIVFLTISLFVFGNKTIRLAEATEYVVADYRQQFTNTVAPSAQQLANTYDLYPSVMIAQAIHESNYG